MRPRINYRNILWFSLYVFVAIGLIFGLVLLLSLASNILSMTSWLLSLLVGINAKTTYYFALLIVVIGLVGVWVGINIPLDWQSPLSVASWLFSFFVFVVGGILASATLFEIASTIVSWITGQGLFYWLTGIGGGEYRLELLVIVFAVVVGGGAFLGGRQFLRDETMTFWHKGALKRRETNKAE